MARRWVLSPVVEEDVDIYRSASNPDDVVIQPHGDPHPGGDYVFERRGIFRQSKVERDYGHKVNVAPVIGLPGGFNWCVCNVAGIPANLADLDSDEDINRFLEADAIPLDLSPNELGWSNEKMQRIQDRLIAKGVDVSGLTKDDPLWMLVARVMQAHWPNCEGPSGVWVFDPEEA